MLSLVFNHKWPSPQSHFLSQMAGQPESLPISFFYALFSDNFEMAGMASPSQPV